MSSKVVLNSSSMIGVCSRSFSKNRALVRELEAVYPKLKLNTDGSRLEGESLVDFLSECEGAIIGTEKIDSSILEKLPSLKAISKYGVGLDKINLKDLEKHGVSFSWTPGVNKRSVSELCLAFILICARQLDQLNTEVRSGNWNNREIGSTLSGKTIGILGLGSIGQDLVRLLKSFDVTILATDIADRSTFAMTNNVEMIGLEALIEKSEILTLHIPLDSNTYQILNQGRLEKMKSGSILINTARGGLVDEKALKQSLLHGPLIAAACDVFEQEPCPNTELLTLPNFFATPHIGGSSKEAVLAMGQAAIRGLK